jgi:hypothetical protein
MNYIFRKKPVDYVTWMMDDHVIKWNNKWFYPAWHKGQYYPHKFADEMGFHLRNARKVFVISPGMAQLYSDRFGVDSEVLFNPADPLAAPVYRSPEPSGPVRLCYFGAMWDWQRDTLDQLVKHLPSLNATLDIFTYHDVPPSLLVDCVRVRPPVPAQEVMPLIREYDGVLITVSFEEQNRGQAELNILTKMSECLASGTVTVMLAPEYAAMVQWVRETGAALMINDLGDPAQLSGIKSLKDPGFRERVLTQARNVAAAGCSVAAMRSVWTKYWDREKEYAPEVLRPSTSTESLQGEQQPLNVLSPIRLDFLRRVQKGD